MAGNFDVNSFNLPLEKKTLILAAYIEELNWQAILCLGNALSVVSNSGAVSPSFHPTKENDAVSFCKDSVVKQA